MRAERREGSEVAEPRERETLGRAERVTALGDVAVRVRTRTVSAGLVARAGGVSVDLLRWGERQPFTTGRPCAPAPPITRYDLEAAMLSIRFACACSMG